MSGICDLRPEHDVIEVEINGNLTAEEGPVLMVEAVQRQLDSGVTRLLADLRSRRDYSNPRQVRELAQQLASMAPPGWK